MSSNKIHIGARGGQFYYSNGRKVYIKKVRGCTKQSSPKYRNRPSPAFPANECCGQIKKRYNINWISEADKNGICKWKKV